MAGLTLLSPVPHEAGPAPLLELSRLFGCSRAFTTAVSLQLFTALEKLCTAGKCPAAPLCIDASHARWRPPPRAQPLLLGHTADSGAYSPCPLTTGQPEGVTAQQLADALGLHSSPGFRAHLDVFDLLVTLGVLQRSGDWQGKRTTRSMLQCLGVQRGRSEAACHSVQARCMTGGGLVGARGGTCWLLSQARQLRALWLI